MDTPTIPQPPAAQDDDATPVGSQLGTDHHVPADQAVEFHPELQGYQDELGTGNKTDALQSANSETASDVTGMSPADLKQELDRTATDEGTTEHASDENEAGGTADDWREEIEGQADRDK
jgi:hypothetical protein